MTRPAARAYALAALLDTVFAGAGRARWVTKSALMPLLATAAGSGTGPAVRVALAGSWLGDVALLGSSHPDRGERALLGGVGGFAVAHAGWLTAIGAARPGQPATRVDVASAAAFATAWAVAVRAVLPRLPDPALRAPVAGYGVLVCGTGHAAVTTGARLGGSRGRRLAAGGALFVVSDALVALALFGGRRRPVVDAAVMATYTAAQALLASALADPTAQPA